MQVYIVRGLPPRDLEARRAEAKRIGQDLVERKHLAGKPDEGSADIVILNKLPSDLKQVRNRIQAQHCRQGRGAQRECDNRRQCNAALEARVGTAYEQQNQAHHERHRIMTPCPA